MAIDEQERVQAILDAAAELVMQYGYDKTTIGDVADAVGLSRGLVYVCFKSKDDLLEALIAREMMKYGKLWIEHIEADLQGGTIGSVYRGVLYALQRTPFLHALVARDAATFGKYLRKPGNLFSALQTPNMTQDFLQELQIAGVVRAGVNIAAVAQIMDTFSASLVHPDHAANDDAILSYGDLIETFSEMLDRMLTPADGGNLEAGKAVLRKIANRAQQQFAQDNEAKS